MRILKVLGTLVAGIVIAAAVVFVSADFGHAADFGGSCCSDLEERISELEATTARKGTEKVSLKIHGQVNKALVYYDRDVLGSDASIVEQGSSETYVGFTGRALIRPGFEAGYSLSLGQGVTVIDPLSGDLYTDNDFYLRESFFFVGTEYGKVSIGRLPLATYNITAAQFGNTEASTKLLTLHPANGIGIPNIGVFASNLELFNGYRDDAIRFDSKEIAGFTLSASWASGDAAKDVALRYRGEIGQFQIVAGVGYLVQDVDNVLPIGESEKLLGSVAVQHIPSGIFVNAAYGKADFEFGVDTDAYHAQVGVQRLVFDYLGPTSVFAEYGKWDDADTDFVGLGFNQNVGALDLYLTGRQYDADGFDVSTVLGGARFKF